MHVQKCFSERLVFVYVAPAKFMTWRLPGILNVQS
jgi:hypothetical protein